MDLCWTFSAIIVIWISPTEFKGVCLNEISDPSRGLEIQTASCKHKIVSLQQVLAFILESDRYLKFWHTFACIQWPNIFSRVL